MATKRNIDAIDTTNDGKDTKVTILSNDELKYDDKNTSSTQSRINKKQTKDVLEHTTTSISKDMENGEKSQHSSESDERVNTVANVYSDIDGYKIAKIVRQKLRDEGRYGETETLTYGEINCAAFFTLLNELPEQQATNQQFCDIGSGTGKPVLVAAMHDRFSCCKGFEIVENLHNSAIKAYDMIKENEIMKSKSISFTLGDSFTKANGKDGWLNADVLFCPTTCFTDEMLSKLEQLISTMQKECIIITTTRKLDTKKSKTKQLFSKRFKYGRGSLSFIVYKTMV